MVHQNSNQYEEYVRAIRMKLLLAILALVGACLPGQAQLIRYQENYKVGYRNEQGVPVVRPVYDAGSDMAEGFAVVLRGSQRGYINNAGQEVIPCQYAEASPFVGGLACVKKGGKWGFLNTKGEWAIQPLFDNAFSFKNGLARVCMRGKWGMIDEQGRVKIPLLYSQLYDVSDGLIAAARGDRKYGYLDLNAKPVIDFRFVLSQPFDEATHKGIVVLPEGRAYYINRLGKVLEALPEYGEHEGRREVD
jgi:hypothetical protein